MATKRVGGGCFGRPPHPSPCTLEIFTLACSLESLVSIPDFDADPPGVGSGTWTLRSYQLVTHMSEKRKGHFKAWGGERAVGFVIRERNQTRGGRCVSSVPPS